MRAMKGEEEAAERGTGSYDDAPMLVPVSADYVTPGPELGDDVVACADPRPAGDATEPRRNQRRREGRSRNPVQLPPGVEHGTRYAYEFYGCRCDPCTDEQADSARPQRAARQARAS